MTELERAVAFLTILDDRTADRLEPFAWGTAVFHEPLGQVYDLNFLRVERPGAPGAELAAEADRLQSGLTHRRVTLTGEEEGTRLEPYFRGAGWQVERHLLMAHVGEPPQLDGGVEEVDNATLEPARTEAGREYPWGRQPETVRQLREARRAQVAATAARFFAAHVDGEVASYADLYSDGRTAQIEDVHTLPRFRRRGLARAVVSHVLAEAYADGNDLVFLVADDDDWPKQLYGELGFRALERKYRFLQTGR